MGVKPHSNLSKVSQDRDDQNDSDEDHDDQPLPPSETTKADPINGC